MNILMEQEKILTKEVADIEEKLESEKKKYNFYSREADSLKGEIEFSITPTKEREEHYKNLIKKTDQAVKTWGKLKEEHHKKKDQLEQLRVEIRKRQAEQTCLEI